MVKPDALSLFHRRLREAVGDEKQTSLARRAGIPQSTLSRIWNGADPDVAQLKALAKATSRSVEWLAGETTKIIGDDTQVQRLIMKPTRDGTSLEPDEGAPFTRLPSDIFTRLGIAASDARVMTATGPMMKPTFDDGDMLLVDSSVTNLANGNIYVFSIGTELHVRRLRMLAARILMKADNQDLYPGEEKIPMEKPLVLHGRVRWAGRVF